MIQILIPPAICLALLPLTAYNATTVLTSSTPYTSAVDNILLLSLGLGAGWLVERLFWPTNNKTILEKQISQTFKLLNQLSHLAFFQGVPSAAGIDSNSLEALNRQITTSISSNSKTVQTSFASGELAPNNRENWDKMISIQYQLLVQLLALLQLLKDNQDNELLQELTSELDKIGNNLQTCLIGLSSAMITPSPPKVEPFLDLSPWQNRLKSLREQGKTQLFSLPKRLSISLIEHRLEGLAKALENSRICLQDCTVQTLRN